MSLRSLAFLLCCASTGFAQAIAPQIASRLTPENLKADVAFLASDTLQGRATPSPGLDAAAEYIASEFRKAGLEPVGDDGYFQTATYNVVTPNMEGFEITCGAVRVTSGVIGEAVSTDLKNAPVVKATPAEIDGLTAEQVRGKVLVVDQSAGRGFGGMRRWSSLSTLEPALVLILYPDLPRAMGSRPALRDASQPAPKFAAVIVSDPSLKEALAKPDAAVSVRIPAPKIEIAKARNVAGLLRGSDPVLKDTYLIVTGHYDHLGVRGTGPGDHIFNGANDDASGTSSVIEIATALASLGERPRRSILFLTVFGEEVGGYGARYYTTHPIFPLSQTIADLNLEQLGRTDDTEGPRPLQFNLTGFDYTDIAATLAKAGAETGIKVVKHEKNSDSFFSRSDNVTFADAGIPDTTISVAYIYPDYHAAGDEWPKLDYANMAKVDTCIALGLWNMANSDQAPQWNRDNPKTARYLEAAKKLAGK
ncbi:MAG: M28 family peptidase [Acidobacteria bacterium]|nr:M28 family peptidase [Acidobacteriota bacterium]